MSSRPSTPAAHDLDAARAVPRHPAGQGVGLLARIGAQVRRLHPTDAPVLERHVWGIIVRASNRPSLALHMTQWIAWAFGIVMTVSGLGLMAANRGDVMALGAGALAVGAAIPLLMFASRGSVGEVHFDRDLGEVREMVLHRIGRPTLLSKRPIDDLMRTELLPLGGRRLLLTLKFRDDSVVPVAAGTMDLLRPAIAEIETIMLAEPEPVRRVLPQHRAFGRAVAA